MSNLGFTLRKFTIPKLEALQVILECQTAIVSTNTISGALSQEAQKLGGTISSLARTKVNGEPLLIAVGKSPEEGMLWKLNKSFGSKEEIMNEVNIILEEIKIYRLTSNYNQG